MTSLSLKRHHGSAASPHSASEIPGVASMSHCVQSFLKCEDVPPVMWRKLAHSKDHPAPAKYIHPYLPWLVFNTTCYVWGVTSMILAENYVWNGTYTYEEIWTLSQSIASMSPLLNAFFRLAFYFGAIPLGYAWVHMFSGDALPLCTFSSNPLYGGVYVLWGVRQIYYNRQWYMVAMILTTISLGLLVANDWHNKWTMHCDALKFKKEHSVYSEPELGRKVHESLNKMYGGGQAKYRWGWLDSLVFSWNELFFTLVIKEFLEDVANYCVSIGQPGFGFAWSMGGIFTFDIVLAGVVLFLHAFWWKEAAKPLYLGFYLFAIGYGQTIFYVPFAAAAVNASHASAWFLWTFGGVTFWRNYRALRKLCAKDIIEHGPHFNPTDVAQHKQLVAPAA